MRTYSAYISDPTSALDPGKLSSHTSGNSERARCLVGRTQNYFESASNYCGCASGNSENTVFIANTLPLIMNVLPIIRSALAVILSVHPVIGARSRSFCTRSQWLGGYEKTI